MTPTAWWGPLLVFVGAGLGALLRWQFGLWWNTSPSGLPWGTWAANVVGGALIGVAMGLLVEPSPWGLSPEAVKALRLLLVTGFLGGLTTFSTFSAEVVTLWTQGRWWLSAGWAAVHLVGSLALTALGWWAARTAWGGAGIS